MLTKEHIITALYAWVKQRPGLEYGNYGDPKTYRSELRSITQDRHHAERLLAAVAMHDSITAEDLLAAFKRAYSGRLSISETADGRAKLEYCTGQYWPTEYRRAACAVLAAALWDWVREHCMPKPCEADTPRGRVELYNGRTAGDFIRHHFKREFGRTIARRWFD